MTKLQPTVKWEKYFTVSNGNYLDYLSKYGQLFLQQVTDNLISAHTTKKPYLVLFTFRDSVISCGIHYDEYEIVLKKIIKLCEKLEYYEICAQILRHFKKFYKRDKKLHKLKFN